MPVTVRIIYFLGLFQRRNVPLLILLTLLTGPEFHGHREVMTMRCQHCTTGLMMPDTHDPGELVCISCGRSTFTVDDPVALSREKDTEGHLHGHRDLVERRSSRARDVGVPQGHISPLLRRFA